MKTAILNRQIVRYTPCRPYPNAATARQTLHKILDLLLVGASGMGIAAMLLLLLTIF